jgi:phospholipid/cholesterol/gamma-HCH transport system substrate-binding protein
MSEKSDRKNAKLGFFVLMGLVLFLVAVFFIGSEKNMFSSTFELHTSFNDVNGLQKGNNVWLSGVKIGTVRRVEIVNDSMVGVTMRIKEENRPFISEDATAFIGSDGLVGNVIVVIEPGKMQRPVKEGDMIASGAKTSTQDILNTLERTGQNVLSVTEDLQTIAQQINSGEGTLGKLISSPELATNLEQAVANLETTGQRTAQVTGKINQMVTELRNNEEGPVYTLLNDTTFAVTYDSLLSNVRVTTNNAAEISNELERLSEKLNSNQNAIDVLLADTTFARDLQKTLNNAAEGTENINESVEALQRHWLFGGIFRKGKKKD